MDLSTVIASGLSEGMSHAGRIDVAFVGVVHRTNEIFFIEDGKQFFGFCHR